MTSHDDEMESDARECVEHIRKMREAGGGDVQPLRPTPPPTDGEPTPTPEQVMECLARTRAMAQENELRARGVAEAAIRPASSAYKIAAQLRRRRVK